MNFDHYLEHNRTDPKRVTLLSIAAALAITGTSGMLIAGWAAGKMTIARVDPPTTEYILLSLMADQTLPPPPPPPPKGGAIEEKPDEPDDPPEDDIVPPDDIPIEIPSKVPEAKASAIKGGIPNGVVGGQQGGQLGGILGGAPTSKIIGGPQTIATKPQNPTPIAKTPLSVVMARAAYTPDPDPKRLQQTKTARFDKRSGKSTIAFCIDANGRVFNVKTKVKFPGDPEIDAILSQTISSWRFKPAEVGSQKMTTCTERIFSISFQ